MFRIPAFDLMTEMTFDEATNIMRNHGRGDLLEGLQAMDRVWEEHCAAQRSDMDDNSDEDFFDNWCYEVNAYNVVVENMRPLFQ